MIVMLADKSAVYDLAKVGLAEQAHGTYEITPEFLQQLGEGAAKNLGGTFVRVWHDHGAGGVFAEISLDAAETTRTACSSGSRGSGDLPRLT